MKVLKIQLILLEKLWTENDEIEVQIVRDLMDIKGRRSREKIKIDNNQVWEKILPQELLDHLRQRRILSKLKIERFRVG